MSSKQILFRSDAREKLLRGATALADAVRVTLGPRSKCVLIDKKFGRPLVCNDGVTIAKELELEDAEENLGVHMLREAAERTSDAVGDGTSTATILAHAIFAEGLRNIAAGASAIDLKRGLDAALLVAVEAVQSFSRPVISRKEKAQIATISAHNDCELGELVANAMEKIGKEGVVSVEEAKGTETSLEVVEGMQIDRGFLSPYFINDLEHSEALIEEPAILLFEKKITNIKDLLPLLEEVAKLRKAIFIVAEDIDGDALATLVVNKIRGVFSCAAIRAPGYGDNRKAMLQDIAILTGGNFISEDLGIALDSVKLSDLGSASRIVCDKDSTTIIGGRGSKQAIDSRCHELRQLIEKSTSDYDKEKLQQRLAKLSGGVAVLRVGAPSEAEMKSIKEALDDAISATKAAMSEGVVPGGGLTLIRSIDALDKAESRV
ncbi:MAG: chaperonin GroEL, partial [Pirellula staleyi]